MLNATGANPAAGRREASSPATEQEAGYRDLYASARDGVRLYARDYGSSTALSTPVVCLPGLARTAGDFHDLALHLSTTRRVMALDYRGRGNSEWSRDWRQYDVRVEADDTLSVLTAAGIHQAIFVGTSRGGLITMALAAMRPSLVRAAILNDMGPVVDGKGLMRIRGYVGKLPAPADYAEGGVILKRMMDAQFPKLTDAEWEAMARQTWREGGKTDKRLAANYDPKLMKSLEAIDFEAPLPPLWHLFEGLSSRPRARAARREFRHPLAGDARRDGQAPPAARLSRRAGPGARATADQPRHAGAARPVRRRGRGRGTRRPRLIRGAGQARGFTIPCGPRQQGRC